MNASDADEALMLRYREGEISAFEQLYARHKAPLYRYLLRQCSDPAMAEELFQDVWLKLVNARQSYTVKAKFTTWFYRLAHNRLVDHYRAQGRRAFDHEVALETVPADTRIQPEQCVERRSQVQRLLELVANLPQVQREAFLLREESGLALEDIAQVTGVNRETAKSRLRYAVAKLRQALGGES